MSVQETRYEMSPEHKAQLAIGREQSRAVRYYLEALRENRPKRGRKRSPDSIEGQLSRLNAKLSTEVDPIRKLHLIAERDRLKRDLEFLENKPDLEALQQAFIAVAREYSARKGISYQAWRTLGVSAAVLREAGIRRAA